MSDVIKEQVVKLIRKYARGGLLFSVMATAIILLVCVGMMFNFSKNIGLPIYIVGVGVAGVSIGLWSAEGLLKKASISMGLWANKKELRKAIKEQKKLGYLVE